MRGHGLFYAEDRRGGSKPLRPVPELLRDEVVAAGKLFEIATKMAKPDAPWHTYARVRGLIRNFSQVYHNVTNQRMRREDHVNACFHSTTAAERCIDEVQGQTRLAGVPDGEFNVRLIVGFINTKRSGKAHCRLHQPRAAEAVGTRVLNEYNSICRKLIAEYDDGKQIDDYYAHNLSGRSDEKCDFSGSSDDKRPGLMV